MAATAQEMLSEPLSLLVLLAALAMAVLAPAFHYHQFGEPTRMARDAGLSALLTCGSVAAVFGTIRSFRREIESGTLSMALAHPVSRAGLFLAKALGGFLAYAVFGAIVMGVTVTMVEGAAVGGALAARTGTLARVWGPCFAAGAAALVLPLAVGAALNRFARCRFVPSAFAVAVLVSGASSVASGLLDLDLAVRLLPVGTAVALLTAVWQAAAAAFAVRFKANAAAAATGVVALFSLPAVGNYYLPDALADGGSVAWTYVALAALAALPAVVFFLLLGVHLINGRDLA